MESEIDLAIASRADLVGLIEQLLHRLEVVEAQLATVTAENERLRQGKDKPAWVKANRPIGEAKPRKKRDRGYGRRREPPTHRVAHAVAVCPTCQVPLTGGQVRSRRQVIELPRVRVRVVEHVVLTRTCPQCQARCTPAAPLRGIVLGRQRVGASVQSEVAVLREEERLPYAVIQQHLQRRYDLHLSVGELVALVEGVATQGQAAYAALRDELRASPVVHGDETGWRENGCNGYLWSFSSPRVRYFTYRQSRGSAVVAQVLGPAFEGVLASDFYGAYNVHAGEHQRCWVHLLRDSHDLKQHHPADEAVLTWAKAVQTLYQRATAYGGPDPTLPAPQQQAARRQQQRQFEQELWALCAPHVKTAVPMRVLCERVERFLPELFVFVANPQVPPDNNAAERSLRPSVISRKISGGTRSPLGSETKSILASLVGTYRLRGRDTYQALRALLSSPKVVRATPAAPTAPV